MQEQKKLDLSLSNLITKAARVVTRDYQKECAPLGITPSQAGIVYILNRLGPLSQTEIAQVLHLEKTNINAMVKKLNAAEIVEVRPVADDGRKTEVLLTDKGRNLAVQLNEVDRTVADIYNSLAEQTGNAEIIKAFLEKIVFG